MTKTKKWSEQLLVKQTFGHKAENGDVVKKELNCLQVCLSGKDLYNREFRNDKYKGKNMLALPFDFIVQAGDMCPEGRFYELEYTIGEYGVVYRGLIQAVDPVTDLQLIIGTLKSKNLLPADMKSHRAFLRDDIDVVCIGNCSKDEDGEAAFYSGHKEAKDGTKDDGTRMSVLDYAVKYGNLGCNIEYYRGDCREVWIPRACDCSKEKVFVCGVNGDDPDFAEKREAELQAAMELLDEVQAILTDYNIPFFMFVGDKPDEEGRMRSNFRGNVEAPFMHEVIDAAAKVKNKE